MTLLGMNIDLLQRSWGWPLFVAGLGGIAVAVAETQSRRVALCLLLIAVSYYAGFIGVVRYTFDRYLLPICVIQAMFAGIAFDRFLRWPHGLLRAMAPALVAAVFAYSILYATPVDVLMVRDSRYAAEQWLDVHAGRDHFVGTMFPPVVLPRLQRFQHGDVGTIASLRENWPSYYVLNADYARAIPADSPGAELIAGLQHETLGYRLAFRWRTPSPWPWLPGGHPDLVGPRLQGPVLSFLRDINPTIEIYERAR
jgi:hypothetical protein